VGLYEEYPRISCGNEGWLIYDSFRPQPAFEENTRHRKKDGGRIGIKKRGVLEGLNADRERSGKPSAKQKGEFPGSEERSGSRD